MRAFLHYNGIHLNPKTEEILIPERSFIRSGFDTYHEKVLDDFEKAYSQYLTAPNSETEVILKNTGKQLASLIKKYARDLKEPPKSDASKILGTKNSNPLIETGAMINHITYRIEGGK